jgi:hypothetical protein
MFYSLPGKDLVEDCVKIWCRLPSMQKDWNLVWFFAAHYSKVTVSLLRSPGQGFVVSINIPATSCSTGAHVRGFENIIA